MKISDAIPKGLKSLLKKLSLKSKKKLKKSSSLEAEKGQSLGALNAEGKANLAENKNLGNDKRSWSKFPFKCDTSRCLRR
ncbi:hypothetical protein FRX31_014433, partial [Thalictrum thalictroides]